MDYKLPLPTSFKSVMQVSESSSPSSPLVSEPCSRRPIVYLAVVDERGDGTFMNAAVEVLSRIIRDLPAEARFGLMTVSDRIGLWDLSGNNNESAATPHVSFVDITSTLPLLNLVDVYPLSDLALSIASCRRIALECITHMSDICSGPHEGRENYLLEALEGIVDLCIKETREGSNPLPFTGIKILFFLSEHGMENQNLTARQELVKTRKIDDLLSKCAMWGGISVSFHGLKNEMSSPKEGNEKGRHSLGLSSIRRLASATGKPSALPCNLLRSQATKSK